MTSEAQREQFTSEVNKDSWFAPDGTDERYVQLGIASIWFERGWQACLASLPKVSESELAVIIHDAPKCFNLRQQALGEARAILERFPHLKKEG